VTNKEALVTDSSLLQDGHTAPVAEWEGLREQARLALLRAEVCAALAGTDPLPGMLRRCADALAGGLQPASARLWTFDEARGTLQAVSDREEVPLGQGLVGRIAATREPLLTADPPFAGYPLLGEGRLLGVLAVSSPGPLSTAALQALELIAAQLAIGLERKRAEDALHRANAELGQRVGACSEELSRSQAELRDRTEMFQEFCYIITHDFKSSLRTVKSQVQRVIRTLAEQLPADASDRLSRVLTAVDRMADLEVRVRDYAQVSLDAPPTRVECMAAVATALDSLEAAVQESQAQVVVGELPTVTGIAPHLELLFQNLIGNAIKYRSPDRPPRVEVGARRQEGGWLFWVKDNGEGVEPKYWLKIFNLGERLDAKRSGWGYGLAICEKSVARHGGRIWVASEPGQGSTFFFTLPDQPPMRGWRQASGAK
jgi:signal transduction histidine kinase